VSAKMEVNWIVRPKSKAVGSSEQSDTASSARFIPAHSGLPRHSSTIKSEWALNTGISKQRLRPVSEGFMDNQSL